MKEKNIVIGVLILIIIALVGFIVYTGNKSYGKGANGIAVLESCRFEEYNAKMLVLKIKNTSNTTYNNVSPIVILKDENGVPFSEGWASKISYFAPGDERYVEVYDAAQDYSNVEVGLYDRDEKNVYTDLRDQIEFTSEEGEADDEEALYFHVNNKSDKEAAVQFQIAYYDGDKLFYEDQFDMIIDANDKEDSYEYIRKEFEDGTKFPEGFSYKISLAEAVDFQEIISDDEEGYSDEDNIEVPEIDYSTLNDEEKIEHALFGVFNKAYGSDMASAKIVVDKIYTKEEIEKDEALKSLKINDDELAFEASIDFEPAEGADPMIFTIPDGEINKANGWVTNVHRLGILTPDEEEGYTIRNLGTGW